MLLLLDLLAEDASGFLLIGEAGKSEDAPVQPGADAFWAEGFWADGFWSEGFWGEAGSAVVHPPYVETEYVVSRAARLAVRTSVDAARLLTKVDGASVLGRVRRIDLFERPKLEARRESKLRSKKAVLRQAASVLTVPRTENVATRALHTVVTTLPDDYVTWNELECMRVLDRKHVVTVKQGAEGYSAADATGVAAWGRVKSGEVTPVAVLDFDISTTGGSGFGQMNTTNVVALGPIAAPSVVITA